MSLRCRVGLLNSGGEISATENRSATLLCSGRTRGIRGSSEVESTSLGGIKARMEPLLNAAVEIVGAGFDYGRGKPTDDPRG